MLGIYGGTFDPVHFGHLRTALEAKEALGITDLRFLPCRLPPHRDTPGASPDLRLLMLELALENADSGFCIDRRELDREGPSYMVDTLASLRGEVFGQSICLILGVDAFAALTSWHRWRGLFGLAHLVVMQRPNCLFPSSDNAELADCVRERLTSEPGDLLTQPFGKILFLEVSQLPISATKIRWMIANGKNPRYLLPDSVLAVIRSQGLYQTLPAGLGNHA